LRPKLQEVRNHADTTNRPREIRFIPAPFVEYYYHNYRCLFSGLKRADSRKLKVSCEWISVARYSRERLNIQQRVSHRCATALFFPGFFNAGSELLAQQTLGS
jgi:hypothetical protein